MLKAQDFWKSEDSIETQSSCSKSSKDTHVDTESLAAGADAPLAPVDVTGSAFSKPLHILDELEPDGTVLAIFEVISVFMTRCQ